MTGKNTSAEPISVAFSAELASILFDTPANPQRDGREVEVVRKFEDWIRKTDRTRIWRMALMIDDEFVPVLSGKNLLHVAKLLEDRAPTIIDSMPNLRRHKEHLQRAAELAEILSPSALDKLISALHSDKGAAAQG
jgi:hypothetical protein